MKKVTACSLIFLILAVVVTSAFGASQQDSSTKLHTLLPELTARKSATKTVMPTYPEDAVRAGISGLVHVKLQISRDGEVLRIKVKPRTNPLLRRALQMPSNSGRLNRGMEQMTSPCPLSLA